MKDRVFLVAVPLEVGGLQEILGSPVIFTGVGKINAASAAHHAVAQGFRKIVNIGSCGSLSIPVAQVVQIGRAIQDIDATPLCGYGETPFEDDSHQIILDPSLDATCFSTDYFYDSKQNPKYSPSYLKSIQSSTVFDMECYAQAKVCRGLGVSYRSYKWVSDSGDGSDWQENCRIGLGALLSLLAENPC
jgi:adenosylhomocysteine nucleosidase